MNRLLTSALVTITLLLASHTTARSAVCVPAEDGQLRCTISKLADCDAITDYPYARDLFCPSAFLAIQTMVDEVGKTLGANRPARGFFHFFQAQAPDPEAQTTIACMDTPAPYPAGSRFVVGAGLPLCHLTAYVTSPGPDSAKHAKKSDNPVPKDLRTFPAYFTAIYSPHPSLPLTEFRPGSFFDPLVQGLGAGARDGFIADYKNFSPTKLYDPAHWLKDPQYHGISGGGGGGWGGEIALVRSGASATNVLLAFGGGGGGGMTSKQPFGATVATSTLGGGGGGGMQFANGYQFKGKHYNGLGLGAGTGTGERVVQYSYNDYDGSPNPPLPVHQYNAKVIAEFKTQMKNLEQQLKAAYKDDKEGTTVVLRGGGGMGAGAEYLKDNGQEFEPHALSTQAGFQFSYEFDRGRAGAANGPLDSQNAEQEDLYTFLGDAYRMANQQAFEDCGQDYSNFACMCPRMHAVVICLVTEHIGDATKIPSWLQQRHCPDDDVSNGQPNGFTGYQRVLLAATQASSACDTALRQYFTIQNTPVDGD